ncbi:MAG: hypothetical protein HY687_05805 [Chloroflexi bacterium]|nr:hypothetical protein [Chloroflexota bacterium]
MRDAVVNTTRRATWTDGLALDIVGMQLTISPGVYTRGDDFYAFPGGAAVILDGTEEAIYLVQDAFGQVVLALDSGGGPPEGYRLLERLAWRDGPEWVRLVLQIQEEEELHEPSP